MVSSTVDSSEDFWIKQEKLLNTKILCFALAQYLEGTYKELSDLASEKWDKRAKPIWGISFVSERGFHFYHFPQQNWFSSLITKNADKKEYRLDLDFSAITAWRAPPEKQSFWQTIFSGRDDCIILTSGDTTHFFNLDIRKTDMIKHLQQVIASKKIENPAKS